MPMPAVSVASFLTAATVLVLGYRLGRTHAAWRDLRDAKRAISDSRRTAWRHTLVLAMGTVALLASLFVAGYTLLS
jgi:hypothetical protein